MVRPNGSVIGRESESGELDKDAVMPGFALAAARSPLNLGALRGLHNPSTAPVSSTLSASGPARARAAGLDPGTPMLRQPERRFPWVFSLPASGASAWPVSAA